LAISLSDEDRIMALAFAPAKVPGYIPERSRTARALFRDELTE
jgi:hypothetical protein